MFLNLYKLCKRLTRAQYSNKMYVQYTCSCQLFFRNISEVKDIIKIKEAQRAGQIIF